MIRRPILFARYGLGEYAGFIVGWSDWISTCGTISLIAIVVGDFSGGIFPALAGQTQRIAAGIAIAFAVLQWRGIALGSGIQNVTTLLKGLAFVALIAAIFVFGQSVSPFTAGATGKIAVGSGLLAAVIISLQSVIYTYDGWTGVIIFRRSKSPGRDIPRSMFGGVGWSSLFTCSSISHWSMCCRLKNCWSEFAAGVAAQLILASTAIQFSLNHDPDMLSSINANVLMASRVLFAMARDGLVSRQAANVNRGGTPTVSLLLSTAVALLFIVFARTFGKVISVVAFFFVANYALSFTTVFVLRWREPLKERPYRSWGYPFTTGLVLLGSVAFLIGAVGSDLRNGSRDSLYALLLLAASYPAFRVVKLLMVSEKSAEPPEL